MGFLTEYRNVNTILQEKQAIVFYAESRHYYQYYQQLLNDILTRGKQITYITSDLNDPLLRNASPGMKVFHVKWMLGYLFSRLRSDVVIMTMPDLGNFLFKRSKEVGSYIYLFHAAVSTHQQYRKAAFFNYDCIFCTGPYQEIEIRAAEKQYGQPRKEIIHYGYPLFDSIKKEIGKRPGSEAFILIAPSWFDGCIFDCCMEELIHQLSFHSRKVILRSHPEYEKRKKREFRKIQKLIASSPLFELDTMPSVLDRLPFADMLITDRSGIAFEYAFGVGKPVLFIDTKLKEVNPEWRELEIDPIENSLRSQLGVTISPASLQNLDDAMKECELLKVNFAQKMGQIEKEMFFNSAESYKAGLEYVLGRVKG
jgi:hypothetical protein